MVQGAMVAWAGRHSSFRRFSLMLLLEGVHY